MTIYKNVMTIITSIFLNVCVSSFALAFDHAHTINLAGKQRMLTQKMSKEVLLIANEIDAEKNLSHLKATRNLFDKTLKGLKDGDSDLGLSQTKKRKIRKQLDKVIRLWMKFDKSIQNIINNQIVSPSDIQTIATNNIPLLKEMNKAVKFYEADAAGVNTNPALAKAINVAGRQRMLTQKMSKEFMFVAMKYDIKNNKANLSKTVALFDNSLNGLIHGDPSLSLADAPNEEIKEQLQKVKGLWTRFRKNIEKDSDQFSKTAVAEQNIPLLKEMNKAVQMYTKLSNQTG